MVHILLQFYKVLMYTWWTETKRSRLRLLDLLLYLECALRHPHVLSMKADTLSQSMSWLTRLVTSDAKNFNQSSIFYQKVFFSLGMRHDGGDGGNSCSSGSFIMSPTLGSGKISWSPCSRAYLHRQEWAKGSVLMLLTVDLAFLIT